MLVLSRKTSQAILIRNDIRIVVLEIKGSRVKLGITAPDSDHVVRQELSANEESST